MWCAPIFGAPYPLANSLPMNAPLVSSLKLPLNKCTHPHINLSCKWVRLSSRNAPIPLQVRPLSNVSLLLHGSFSSKQWRPLLTQWANPHASAPLSPQEMRPCSPLPLLFSQVNLKNALYPPLAYFGQALKYQWPRSNLAKSNQWVRSHPKISPRKPTFLSCFMSINSPTL
jgi:hypothetical protein